MTAQVITYDPRYAGDFAALNYAWIEQYFAVEAEDRAALEDPEGYAIAPGGEIFFVVLDGQAVGTVAMVPYKANPDPSRTVFELAKMAVDPNFQGKGFAHLLMDACIDFANAHHATEIVLITNDILAPALGLYTGVGFVAQPTNSDNRYSRGNLEMRLKLQD